MQHEYTDAEIIGAWNNRKLPKNITLATNLRAFLATLPKRPQAQPGPWPGQQEAIDAAFEKQNIQYLDGSSLCDDWNHEAPARLAIAQAYDAARPQSAEIASLKAALAESEKQFQAKVYEIACLLDECDKAKAVDVNEPPHGEKQPDLSGESEKQDLGAMVKAAKKAAIEGLTGPAWIPHDGGPCPLVDEEVEEFEFKIRQGGASGHVFVPSGWRWGNDGTAGDIIAYRVLKWKPGFGPEAKPEPQPATFEARGKTWTRHTPGDPMPCDGDAEINYMMRDHGTCSDLARTLRWAAAKGHESRDADIIGWRYAEEPVQPTTSPGWTPAVGDTVRLKSGGPVMTVHHISKDGSIACTHNANGEFKFATLPAACLTPVQS